MRRVHGAWVCTLLAWLGLVACSSDPLADGVAADYDCSTCHGDAESSAPPVSVRGQLATDELGIGAHRSHLRDGALALAVACDECHRVPTEVDAPGHIDPLPAELTFGSLARADGAAPDWDREQATCIVYCHGATLAGGTNTAPAWTTVDGTQAACGTCHGTPPALPHPSRSDCNHCHPDTVDASGGITVAGGRHINGAVDIGDGACDACHGDIDSPAPPLDTSGNSLTTARGVGAHREHLALSTWRRQIRCDECHLVPAQRDDPGHDDSALPAELVWGPLAAASDSNPTFDGVRCHNVYCHGDTLSLGGGATTTPEWTLVDGSQNACGACHALPPTGALHPQNPNCSICHGAVVDAAMVITAPERHIDGQVDLNAMSCESCHSIPASPINPVVTNGELDAGKHVAHASLDCEICHLAYDTTVTHRDGAYGVAVAPATRLLFFDPSSAAGGMAGFTDNTDSSGELLCDIACHRPVAEADWYRGDTGVYSCPDCHRMPVGARRQIYDSNGDGTGVGGDFAKASHHVIDYGDRPSLIVTPADCEVCHDQRSHVGGEVLLWNKDDPNASILYDPADAASLEPFCLSCHDSDGAMADPVPMRPFSSSNQLGVIPNEAGIHIRASWNKSKGHRRHGLTCLGDGTPGTGCHGNYDAATQTGSVNAHGSDNVGLLANEMVLPIPDATWDENRFRLCSSCHDSSPNIHNTTQLLGVAAGGNYAQLSPQLPQYSVESMVTPFHDYRAYNYDRQWNLHSYHVAGNIVWYYRGESSQPTAVGTCVSCHNVHGVDGAFGLWDEWGFEIQQEGGIEYGRFVGAVPTFGGPLQYPEYCGNACHWDSEYRYPRTPFNEVWAVAEDASGMGPGLHDGDTVTLFFSSPTNTPVIDEANIDELLPVCQTASSNHGCTSPEHSWIDSDKGVEVGSLVATWSSSGIDGRVDDVLTIEIFVSSEGSGDPTILDSDLIMIREDDGSGPGSGITDLNGTEFRGHLLPMGSF